MEVAGTGRRQTGRVRRVVVSVLVSADGFQSGRGGDLSVLPFDEGFSRHNLERLRTAGTLLFGRRSYEGFEAYWPQVLADEAQPPVEREIARINSGLDKLVVSDSLVLDPGSPWAATTRVVPRADAVAEVAALREGDGGDVLAFGAVTTWNPLIRAGVVDELHVLVGPALVGDGVPLYSGDRVPLTLRETRRLSDSQLVLLRFGTTPPG